MKSERIIPMARSIAVSRCAILLLCLSAWPFLAVSTASAQQQEAVRTAPEPAPQQPPLTNWFRVSSPGTRALAGPGSFPEYGPYPGGVCCPGCKNGSFCHRLLEWATYCPKYRVCSCTQGCNSCQYKGVVPPYLFMLNPKCMCGSGLRQEICNVCYRGSKECLGAPSNNSPCRGCGCNHSLTGLVPPMSGPAVGNAPNGVQGTAINQP